MTDAEQIATIKTQALARLAEITAEAKPSYNVDGQMISWNEYTKQLWEIIERCDKQLAGDAPFEVHSSGYTA